MKLAEALQERADLNRQIEQLKARLYNNALVQEGEAPAEDPNELLAQLDRSTARLEELMAAINLPHSGGRQDPDAAHRPEGLPAAQNRGLPGTGGGCQPDRPPGYPL